MSSYPNVQQPPNPLNFFERWQKRVQNNFRQIVARGDITVLIIVWSLMLLPVFALETANWADGMLSLTVVAFFSVLFGYVLGWSRLSESLALIVSSLYGFLIACASMILFVANGGGPLSRTEDFIVRVGNWSQAVSAGGTGEDNLVFVFFMAILFWFLGYSTAWHVFRIDRVWRAILPPGIVLLINNFYYLEDAPVDVYLILYVFLALLLIVRSHVDAREYEWYRNKVRYSRNVRKYFLRVGAMMAILVVLVAWILPTGQDDDNLDRFQEFLNSISQFGDAWDRLFSSLESQGIASPEYYGGDRLELSGAIQLGDDPVLEVNAPPVTRWYWKSTALDTYIAGTWEHNRTVRATKEGEGLRLNIGDLNSRSEVAQDFTMLMTASSLVYAAPQAVEYGVPVKVELDCVTTPEDFQCVNEGLPVDPSVARALDPLREDDEYTIISSISTANAFDLRATSIAYPQWVLNRYLQYGDRISPQLRNLTQQIVAQAGAVTAYDKAKAIEYWLRLNITYDENIPNPPPGVDPVDWAVFDIQRGYCNYYASAMILMLRSEGIPARMAAGFSQGEFDPNNNTFLVRERDAHTWVEVYFPDYGWVEFEPTANEAPLDREGDEQQNDPLPNFTPEPTHTPTLAPTNTPFIPPAATATPTATSTPPDNQEVNPPTETPTLIPTNTPTATPVPPALQDTEVSSDGRPNILEIILLLVATFFVFFALFATGVAFTIWWVEHRGLGGLTVVEKTYARLAIYGNWLGIRMPPQHTPIERRNTLVRNVPDGQEPIEDITSFYIERHFAPPRDGEEADELAELAWSKARMAFIRRKIAQWLGRV